MASFVVAIQGFLEWFFAILLTMLVGAVGLFALFMFVQFFRNPGRQPRSRS
jgi:hypothetical protein